MRINLFPLLLLLLTACGNETPATEDAAQDATENFNPAEIASQTGAYESMMDGHDRVMARMGEITQVQKALKDASAAEGIDEERKTALTAAYDELENAYDGMMNWMRDIKSMDDLRTMTDQTEILNYISAEAVKMNGIEASLDAGTQAAKTLLGALPETTMEHDGEGHDHGHDHHNH